MFSLVFYCSLIPPWFFDFFFFFKLSIFFHFPIICYHSWFKTGHIVELVAQLYLPWFSQVSSMICYSSFCYSVRSTEMSVCNRSWNRTLKSLPVWETLPFSAEWAQMQKKHLAFLTVDKYSLRTLLFMLVTYWLMTFYVPEKKSSIIFYNLGKPFLKPFLTDCFRLSSAKFISLFI